MNSSTTLADLATDTPGTVFDLGGLYADFDELSDNRKARGRS
jgi:hypothetical protein